MEKLIKMSDFVMQQNMHYANKDIAIEKLQLNILNYAMFLKKSLTLGMFVPCDFKGNVLTEPKEEDYFAKGFNLEVNNAYFNDVILKEYQEAKERCIFEGFKLKYEDNFVTTVSNERLWFNFKSRNIFVNDKLVYNVEDIVKYQLFLTESAKKQIGL